MENDSFNVINWIALKGDGLWKFNFLPLQVAFHHKPTKLQNKELIVHVCELAPVVVVVGLSCQLLCSCHCQYSALMQSLVLYAFVFP